MPVGRSVSAASVQLSGTGASEYQPNPRFSLRLDGDQHWQCGSSTPRRSVHQSIRTAIRRAGFRCFRSAGLPGFLLASTVVRCRPDHLRRRPSGSVVPYLDPQPSTCLTSRRQEEGKRIGVKSTWKGDDTSDDIVIPLSGKQGIAEQTHANRIRAALGLQLSPLTRPVCRTSSKW